jgi:propanediol dehydratase large subunit
VDVSLIRSALGYAFTGMFPAISLGLVHALNLYEYNVALSEMVYRLLHGLEVAITNSIDRTLTAALGAGYSFWRFVKFNSLLGRLRRC